MLSHDICFVKLFENLLPNILIQLLVVVALLFYIHGKHPRSCRDGQLT